MARVHSSATYPLKIGSERSSPGHSFAEPGQRTGRLSSCAPLQIDGRVGENGSRRLIVGVQSTRREHERLSLAKETLGRLRASLRQTKKRPFAIAATLTSAVSVFRLVSEFMTVPLARVLAAIIETYRTVLIEPIQFFLGLMHLRPPEALLDALILYCMFGGAALRIQSVLHSLERQHPWLSSYVGRNRLSVSQLGRSVAAFAQWPLVISRRWSSPILIIPAGGHGPGRPAFTTAEQFQKNVMGKGAASSRHDMYVADARILFVAQLALIAMALAVLIALNYVGVTLDQTST